MKILFLIEFDDKRNNIWDGELIRKGEVGVSGTEQSFVLVAEYLAKNNNVIIAGKLCKHNSFVNNVMYYDYRKIPDIATTIDIIITASWNERFFEFYYPNLKKLIFWCQGHMILSEQSLYFLKKQYLFTQIIVNTMNSFVEKCIDTRYSYYNDFVDKKFQTKNPLMLDLFENKLEKEKNSFIFFACFERGGEVAVKAFQNMIMTPKKMYIAGYNPETQIPINDTDIVKLGSIDKKQLFKLLSKTEYFIYPLVNPNYVVHKDTDACVIAEALLHEVIVLSFPVAALPELYKDYVLWIPFPDGCNIENLRSVHESIGPLLYTDDVIKYITNIIDFIENNPQLKENLKKKGREFILSQRDEINMEIWRSITTSD